MLNLIKLGAEFQKTLKYLISKGLNRYQGQKKSEIGVGIRFDLITDFPKCNYNFSKMRWLLFLEKE